MNSENSNTPQKRGERLRMLRKMVGLTIHRLAKKYEIGCSTIKYWECGRGEGITAKGADKIIAAIRQEGIYSTTAWLMYGIGDTPYILDMHQSTSTKLVGLVSTTTEESAIANEINLFQKNSNTITLTIHDDSMDPLHVMGDTVGGICLTSLDITKAINRNCIVEIENNQFLCRKIMRKKDSDLFTLCSLNPYTTINPANLYDVKIVNVAPISRVWKRVILPENKN